MMEQQPTPREIVEEYADEEGIVQAASFTSEGARIVCHTQINLVPTVYAVVAEFYVAADAIETASANMIGDLSRLAAVPDLYHARPGGDPLTAIDEAKGALTRARAAARQLGDELRAAQNAIAAVGHNADERRA
jgi:roadblock/LC7 domain-containing protein